MNKKCSNEPDAGNKSQTAVLSPEIIHATVDLVEKYGVSISDAGNAKRRQFASVMQMLPAKVRRFFEEYDALSFDGGESYDLDIQVMEVLPNNNAYCRIGTFPSGESVLSKIGVEDTRVYLEDDEYELGNGGIGTLAPTFEEYIIERARDEKEAEVQANLYLKRKGKIS